MQLKKTLIGLGVVLLALALFGIMFPRAGGDAFWFDAMENWIHLILGTIALVGAYALPPRGQYTLGLIFGVIFLYAALAGFLVASRAAPNYFGIMNLEHPADNILHLILGAVALWRSFAKK